MHPPASRTRRRRALAIPLAALLLGTCAGSGGGAGRAARSPRPSVAATVERSAAVVPIAAGTAPVDPIAAAAPTASAWPVVDAPAAPCRGDVQTAADGTAWALARGRLYGAVYGRRWRALGPPAPIAAFCRVGVDVAWAASASYDPVARTATLAMWRTLDGGETWSWIAASGLGPVGDSRGVVAIQFTGADDGWLVAPRGAGGVALYTTSDGTTWTERDARSGAGAPLSDGHLDAVAGSTAWLASAGGPSSRAALFSYRPDSRGWVESPATPAMLPACPDGGGWQSPALLRFLSARWGAVAAATCSGDGVRVWETADGGATWAPAPGASAPRCSDPSFDVLTPWAWNLRCAVGGGAVLLWTVDAGRTWVLAGPLPGPGASTAFWTTSDGVALVPPDPAAGSGATTVFTTADAGATWQEAALLPG